METVRTLLLYEKELGKNSWGSRLYFEVVVYKLMVATSKPVGRSFKVGLAHFFKVIFFSPFRVGLFALDLKNTGVARATQSNLLPMGLELITRLMTNDLAQQNFS